MTERRKTKWRSGVLLVAIVFGVLFCGAIVVGCLLVIGAITFADTDEDDVLPQVVENVARVRLSPGVRDLRSHLEGFQDRLIWVRFRMPEDLSAARICWSS